MSAPQNPSFARPLTIGGQPPERSATFYEQVGGRETFERLVARFYEGVAGDEVLRPMYPE